uniref:L-dopachrome isomerase n=1 Tax=Rhizophora mucronata TaxID=61149 RepID=A0A2P2J505_RHIMU
MPTLNLYTNVPVDAVTSSDILKDATKVVSKIIGKPESVEFPPFFTTALHFVFDIFSFGDGRIRHRLSVRRNYYVNLNLMCQTSLLFFNLCHHLLDLFFSSLFQYVMILLNGRVPIAFAGIETPAAYGELISMGGLGPSVNGKLSSAIADILRTKLSIDSSRFYIKFYDVQRSFFGFNGSTF